MNVRASAALMLAVAAMPVAVAAHTNRATAIATVRQVDDASTIRCLTHVLHSGDGDTGAYRHGQVKSFVQSFQGPTPASDCDNKWERPKGWLASHVLLWKHTGDAWAMCRRYFGLWHSSAAGDRFDWQYTFTKVPCGAGTYATTGRALVKTRSEGWHATPWIETASHDWI